MRTFAIFTAVICAAAAAADKAATPARVADLIKQLGDDEFDKRQTAGKALEAIGEPALSALVEAAAASDDLEIRRRANELIRAIMPTSRKSKATGLELVGLLAGELEMGSPPREIGRRADEAAHRVRISRPFFLGAYEVTQEEYKKVMKASPSWFAPSGPGKDKVKWEKTERFPVERVTWFDAVEFCNRLSQLDGHKPYYTITAVRREDGSIKAATVTVNGGNGYRLPTEAEWEYACRAGTNTSYHFGTTSSGKEANFKAIISAGGYGATTTRGMDRTTRVGSYPPNRWGLYDMHGNVAEWCQDWYGKDYYSSSPVVDPKGTAGGLHRVQRGGNWLLTQASCRSASRFPLTPGDSAYTGGFRVARNP